MDVQKVLVCIRDQNKVMQISLLLDLLQELGGAIQVKRNLYYQYWAEPIADACNQDIEAAKTIKKRILELVSTQEMP